MKKIIFTAFAVVVFNGISMANSIIQTEDKMKIDKVSYQDCNVWAMNFCEEINGWHSNNSINSYNTYRTMVEFCESFESQYLQPIEDNFIGIEGGIIEVIQP
ncbi:hypothetical protein [Flavobacterium sp. FlaQc-48]|uniref:hypothetical protein n=1 Tax=Flavobacterium sp. FlaQc-48 TaxID=3374181 RepID=UPI0037577F07